MKSNPPRSSIRRPVRRCSSAATWPRHRRGARARLGPRRAKQAARGAHGLAAECGRIRPDAKQSLLHGLAMDLGKGKAFAPAIQPAPIAKGAARFVSDSGELCWDASQPGAGYFTVNTPRSKLFTGSWRRPQLRPGRRGAQDRHTRLDWATISLLCRDRRFRSSRPDPHRGHRSGAEPGGKAQHLGDDKATLGNQWGKEPVMCEGIAAEVLLPVAADRVRFYPLDEAGQRREAVPVEARGRQGPVPPRSRTSNGVVRGGSTVAISCPRPFQRPSERPAGSAVVLAGIAGMLDHVNGHQVRRVDAHVRRVAPPWPQGPTERDPCRRATFARCSSQAVAVLRPGRG